MTVGERFGFAVAKHEHDGGVATEPAQRAHAPVAVDQHQCGVAGLLRGNARHQLPILVHRVGQSLHRQSIHDAHWRKAQFQAVQIDLHVPGSKSRIDRPLALDSALIAASATHEELTVVVGVSPQYTVGLK